LLNSLIVDNGISHWAIAIGVTILTFLILQIARNQIPKRLSARASHGPAQYYAIVAELLSRTHVLFLLFIALYVGSLALDDSKNSVDVIRSVIAVGLLIQGAMWVSSIISYAIERRQERIQEAGKNDTAVVAILGIVIRIALWVIVILLILENLGVKTDGLLASLGITGVAVALATQNILSDLFASFSIALDKPFTIGDFIVVGNERGTVEHIGLKTTRVRSLTGGQLIFSNNDLLTSRIHNYKRMSERRVAFSLGVTYETPHERLQSIPDHIRDIIESHTLARFDRAHFKEYGDFALLFEVVYFVATSDYNTYMDVHQSINLDLFKRFEEEGISFAYPTQTLHINQIAGDSNTKDRG